ncbi:hypothetical protein ZIOFF_053780 [Zingiber officinale]|uniref:Uncharacterized protein n=1 Tax=Zingiber officinale TaxID=94328 RepID=A0A8J5FDL1_ZINOF|nr:hypothetical protein ZIOFF_053780 [Zingiber officinale]
MASSSHSSIDNTRFQAVTFSFAINNNNTTIVLLNGSNFKKWKQDIEFALGIVDLDLALREPEPAAITDTSSVFEKELHAKWDRSNRLILIVIKRSIPEHLLTGLPETNNAKVLFEAIGQRYQVSNKADIEALMNELTSLRFYCPTPRARIVESQTSKFLEHDTADLETPQQLDIDKQSEVVPIPMPNVQTFVLPTPVNGIDQEKLGINAPIVANARNPVDPIPEVPMRRSVRQRRPAISDEFIFYLGESDYDVGPVVDPVTYAVLQDIWVSLETIGILLLVE